MAGVHVVDVHGTLGLVVLVGGDPPDLDAVLVADSSVHGGSVGHQDGVPRQPRHQGGLDVRRGARGDDLRDGGLGVPIDGEQHGNLLPRKPPLAGLRAPPLRGAGHVRPLALEGLADEGLIHLDDARQTARVLGQKRHEAMPPAEGGLSAHAEPLGGLGDAQVLDHAAGVLDVLLGHPQASQRGSRQGVEGRPAAALAPEPLLAVLGPVLHDFDTAAVRAALHGLRPLLEHQQALDVALSSSDGLLDLRDVLDGDLLDFLEQAGDFGRFHDVLVFVLPLSHFTMTINALGLKSLLKPKIAKKFPPRQAGREIGLRQIVAFRGERGSYKRDQQVAEACADCSLPGERPPSLSFVVSLAAQNPGHALFIASHLAAI